MSSGHGASRFQTTDLIFSKQKVWARVALAAWDRGGDIKVVQDDEVGLPQKGREL